MTLPVCCCTNWISERARFMRGLLRMRSGGMLDHDMDEESDLVSRRYCKACGYPLDHLDQPRCPECGREFDPADARTYARMPVPFPRWVGICANFSVIIPLVALASLYTAWVVAWFELGHRPRSSIDDPKFIGGAVDHVYPLVWPILNACGLLVPLGTLLLLVLFFMCLYSKRYAQGMWFLLLLLIWVSPILMLTFDPLRVLDWFLD